MATLWITAGIACLIAAVVGGGLSAGGMSIPVIDSPRRQLALGGLGIVFAIIGFAVMDSPGSADAGAPEIEATAASDAGPAAAPIVEEAPSSHKVTFAGGERWMIIENLSSGFEEGSHVEIYIDGQLSGTWNFRGSNIEDWSIELSPGPHTFRFNPSGAMDGLPLDGGCGGGFHVDVGGVASRHAEVKTTEGRAYLSECSIVVQ